MTFATLVTSGLGVEQALQAALVFLSLMIMLGSVAELECRRAVRRVTRGAGAAGGAGHTVWGRLDAAL